MQTVKYYDNLVEAHVDRELLQAEGLRAEVLNEHTRSVIPIASISSLRPYLVVADHDLARAMQILGLEPPRIEQPAACPYCGSTELSAESDNVGGIARFFLNLKMSARMLVGKDPYKQAKTLHCKKCRRQLSAN